MLTQKNNGLFHASTSDSKPLVGISACLAGEQVRYNGSDKRLPLFELLKDSVSMLAVCPENEAGLGIPRPPVQLIRTEGELRVRGRDNPELDVTNALLQQRSHCYRQLRGQELCGFILKSRSPSCGLGSTPIFENGQPASSANGVFADGLLRLMPWLVTREEQQLDDTQAVENFVWLCQLTQDVLFTSSGTALPAIHRHYLAALGDIDTGLAETLQEFAEHNRREEYLMLLRGCFEKSA